VFQTVTLTHEVVDAYRDDVLCYNKQKKWYAHNRYFFLIYDRST